MTAREFPAHSEFVREFAREHCSDTGNAPCSVVGVLHRKPRRESVRITETIREEAKRLLQLGHTRREVAKMTGLSETSVTRIKAEGRP